MRHHPQEIKPSERFYAQRGRCHQLLTARSWQLMPRVGRWLPGREVALVADSSCAALALLDKIQRLPRGRVITRLRLDAALSDPPPPRASGTIGRPRLTGTRRPTLEAVLAATRTPWTPGRVEQWYGEGPRAVEVATDTAVWYHTGQPPVALRWVLIRDPPQRFQPQALLSTTLAHTPAQRLTGFVQRWTLGVPFAEARAHRGMATQRPWRDRAMARTTPALLSLYSLITLTSQLLIAKGVTCGRSTACYHQTHPTLIL